MTYTTPPTFVAADTLTAAELNILGDDVAYLYAQSQGTEFSAIQASRTTNQSIATGVGTNISFNVQNLDLGGWFTPTSTTITVPAGAIPAGAATVGIIVFASIAYAANGTGIRKISVMKNGSSFGSWKVSALTGDTTDVLLNEATTVAAGDTITLEAEQTSGVSLNVSAARITVIRMGVAS